MSIDFAAWPDWQDAFRVLIRRARHITRVGVPGGRAEWTWGDPQRAQSDKMLEVAVAELGEREICATAVLDVLAPQYLAKRPEYAAVDMRGRRSAEIVCSTALADGEYGRLVTDAFESLAATTSADSLAVTNLHFDWNCYCARCLAHFHARAWRSDWPRLSNGAVDLLNPAIGKWRSAQVAQVVSRLSSAAHACGKQMLFEVKLSRDDFSRNGCEYGQDYALLRPYVDEFVVCDDFALDRTEPAQSTEAARYLRQAMDPDDYWHCVKLGSYDGRSVGAQQMQLFLRGALRGGARRLWLAPSQNLSPSHWQQLDELMSHDSVAASACVG